MNQFLHARKVPYFPTFHFSRKAKGLYQINKSTQMTTTTLIDPREHITSISDESESEDDDEANSGGECSGLDSKSEAEGSDDAKTSDSEGDDDKTSDYHSSDDNDKVNNGADSSDTESDTFTDVSDDLMIGGESRDPFLAPKHHDLRTERSRGVIRTTVEDTLAADQIMVRIRGQLIHLRNNKVRSKRLGDNGKKITSRTRMANCTINSSPKVIALLAVEEDLQFKRVCKSSEQAKTAFMKQSAQFLTHACMLLDGEKQRSNPTGGWHADDAINLQALMEMVVMSPLMIIRNYADWLEESAQLAHDSIRGRLCNIMLLLTQFADGSSFRMEIPPIMVFIKARGKYHKELNTAQKATAAPEELMEAGLLCSKGDLMVMETRLAPILANIFELAAIAEVPMALYNMAMRIIFFQFYGSNLNGRFRAIASMTMKQGQHLIDKLYAQSSKTKCVKTLGAQVITITVALATNLTLYERLLRPASEGDGECDSFFLRHKGSSMSGDDGSKGIATMTDDLFGLYLTVTTLRAINNTQVKLSASENAVNSEQCVIFHKACQGHSGQTAERLYTYMTQEKTASVLAGVNATLNNCHGGDTIMFGAHNSKPDDSDDSDDSYGHDGQHPQRLRGTTQLLTTNIDIPRERERARHIIAGPVMITPTLVPPVHAARRKSEMAVLSQTPPRALTFEDFGLDHVDCSRDETANIAWSADEVDYVKQFQSTCKSRDVFRLCLDSITSNPNSNVRRMFHKKHIRSSSTLRDGVKNK